MNEIEYRCPRDHRTMFGKMVGILLHGRSYPAESPPNFGTDTPLMEFNCAECKRVLGKHGLIVRRVLHRYRLNGEFVTTIHEGER